MKNLVVGIDPGYKTGFAVWSKPDQQFVLIKTMNIVDAISWVKETKEQIRLVRVEDARQRKWFGATGRERLQGVGSVKRDCKIWEDFLKQHNIPFHLVPPKSNTTKLDAEQFKKYTKYLPTTSQHGRDAAMLVFGC